MVDIMENQNIIKKLIHISKEKKALMQNIFDLTNRQRRFLELEKIETVLKQIDLKDKYISEVDELDVKFYTLFNELKKNLAVDSIDKMDVEKYPQMKILKDIVKKILKLTEKIKIVDNQNINMLKQDMDEIRDKLKGVKKGQKATNAYGAYKNQISSMFFDKKK
ncbi:FlgN protein [Maledivibacter halophilus]|uniref:FlgN protein n=2 Tax=Maledivibacter halophilus TaxID=36842 RepID=A0A1T5JWQ1_9FIRM|nr:FlgN protein [Maledivibacter halophilus]